MKLLVALGMMVLPSASAATDPEKWWIRCGGPFNLCGYVERDSEEARLPKRFEVAKPFSDGMAAVRIDGRYGYIDTSGRIVIEPRYEAAGPFTGDYAEVRVDGLSGAIDRSGHLVVPAQFSRMVPFADGSFIAKPLPSGATRSSMSPRLDGEIHLEGLADSLVGLGGGIYHLKKGWLTAADLQFSIFDNAERGLVWAGRRNAHHDEKWGLLRADGTWQVMPRYNHVQRLMETHAIVGSMPDYTLPPIERRKSLRRGAVDRDGNLAVPTTFDGLWYWRGGYGPGATMVDGVLKKVIVKGDGSLLGGRAFDDIEIGWDDSLPRVKDGATWYSIKRDGRLIADQREGTPMVACKGGPSIIHRGEGVEFRKRDNGPVIGRFDKGYWLERDCPGPFHAKRDGKWFIVMENGALLGGKNGYDDSSFFAGSNASVKLGGKWGIINRSGVFTVRPNFDKLRRVQRDVFVVGEGKGIYWINAAGKRVAKPAERRPSPEQALTCAGGLRLFDKDGLWGLRDESGRVVIEPRYRALSCFARGIVWVAALGAKRWCPIGPDGARREALDCRLTYYPVIVTHHYPEKFSDDPFESSVSWNIAWLEHAAGRRAAYPKWVPDDSGRGSYSVSPGAATNR
ncbi:MAG: WG repeat-containing protein [Pseudomonadota bacterium]